MSTKPDDTTDDESNENEEPEVFATRYAGHNYESTTTVFTRRSDSEVFHADSQCPHLMRAASFSGIHGKETVHLNAHPLEKVLTTYRNPVRPCDHCTLSMEETVKIAVQMEGLPANQLKIFETGDKRVTTQVSRNDDGTVTVSESAEVIGE